LDAQLAELEQALGGLPALNPRLRAAGLKPIERRALPAAPVGAGKESGGGEE
jgi:hypothetical protein